MVVSTVKDTGVATFIDSQEMLCARASKGRVGALSEA
jgi:hypothetical protein